MTHKPTNVVNHAHFFYAQERPACSGFGATGVAQEAPDDRDEKICPVCGGSGYVDERERLDVCELAHGQSVVWDVKTDRIIYLTLSFDLACRWAERAAASGQTSWPEAQRPS